MSKLILLGLSVGDIMSSFFVHFVGSWAAPPSSGAYGASGTIATCTIQGFIGKWFAGTANYYNVSLSILFLLMVRYKWTEKDLKTWKAQFFLLYLPPILNLILSIYPLIDNGYNFGGLNNCFIQSVPLNCKSRGVDCERGEHMEFYNLWFSTLNLAATNVLLLIFIALLIWTVFQIERKNDRYLAAGMRTSRRNTKDTAIQGMLYILAFFLTYLPWYVLMIMKEAGQPYTMPLLVWTVCCVSSQGVFNAFVYFHKKLFAKLRCGNNSEGGNRLSFMAFRSSVFKTNTRMTENSSSHAVSTTRASGLDSIKEFENETAVSQILKSIDPITPKDCDVESGEQQKADMY
uniref:G-protein coupled receptors family 1 profile domain-containing protein n=1 Tax=Ditylum brightwellii TaxID=49249 RepID=A0A7S4R9A9_9STRA